MRICIYENAEIFSRTASEDWVLFRRQGFRILYKYSFLVIFAFLLLVGAVALARQSSEKIQIFTRILASWMGIIGIVVVGGILFAISGKYILYKWNMMRMKYYSQYSIYEYFIEFDSDSISEYDEHSDDPRDKYSWSMFDQYYILPTSIRLYIKRDVYRVFPRECLGDVAFNDMARIVKMRIPKGLDLR